MAAIWRVLAVRSDSWIDVRTKRPMAVLRCGTVDGVLMVCLCVSCDDAVLRPADDRVPAGSRLRSSHLPLRDQRKLHRLTSHLYTVR